MHPRESMTPLLDGLNEIQREGVTHGDGPLLILAGAGSGKTRVLTRRLANLVATRGVDPYRILAVTFTNKAAGEMRDRVSQLLGTTATSIWIGTFHSICLRILKRHQERLGFRGNLTVFDTDDQLALLREVIKDSGGSDSEIKPQKASSVISMAKNMMLDPDSFASVDSEPARRRIASIWRSYDSRLRAQDGVDFDDILLLALRLLDEDREIGDRYSDRFLHVLVDEYQDTNRAQFHIVRRLAQSHGNVCVVGDDDQSIYAWRGADITNILEFERHFEGAKVLRMEQNYRSTGAILDVANAVVKRNVGRKEKTIWTTNGPGEPVRLFLAGGEEEEARYVSRRVSELVRSGDSPDSFAVLYRTHAQSRALEEALLRGEIAYQVLGGVSFYQRREVKDLLAYLRLIVNPHDEISFRRAALAPRRGAGEKTLDRIVNEARERGVDLLSACGQTTAWGIRGRGLSALSKMAELLTSLSEDGDGTPHLLIDEIARSIDYRGWLKAQDRGDWEDRWAHVIELIEGAKSYESSEEGSTLSGYLEQVALYAQTDQFSADQDRVTLMTVHNAKGLEFNNVFVTGLEEGLFPHISSMTDPQQLEEERRLFYVASTRACSRLTLTACRQRRRINYTGSADLSRFLLEIPQELLTVDGLAYGAAAWAREPIRGSTRGRARERDDSWDEPTIERAPATMSVAGLKAKHVRYGIGSVVSIDGEGDQARVEVIFPVWGTKKILRSYLTILEEE